MATQPGAWHYRVSAWTGWPGVSILWLGEMESSICNFYLSVAAHKIVQTGPWDTLACCWDVKQPTNNNQVHSVLSLLVATRAIPWVVFSVVHRLCSALECGWADLFPLLLLRIAISTFPFVLSVWFLCERNLVLNIFVWSVSIQDQSGVTSNSQLQTQFLSSFGTGHPLIYQGFPTRMVYLYYISCLRYTILAGNPQYMPLMKTKPAMLFLSPERKRANPLAS